MDLSSNLIEPPIPSRAGGKGGPPRPGGEGNGRDPDPPGPRRRWGPLAVSLLISLGIFAGVFGLRLLGVLQYAELKAYDLMIWKRPADVTGALRVTIVEITEKDISGSRRESFHHPIHDDELADLLDAILEHEPRAVGVDIFRNFDEYPEGPEGKGGRQHLKTLWEQNPHVVFVLAFGKPDPRTGAVAVRIPAPTGLDPGQAAAVDLVEDHDGVTRRGLLFMPGGVPSLAMLLANIYLAQESPPVEPTPVNPDAPPLAWLDWVFGSVTIRHVRPNDGGYVRADSGAIQYLLDYKVKDPGAFVHLTAGDVKAGKFGAGQIRGKVVLIGMTAESAKDFLTTPVRATQNRNAWYGVEVHAAAIDQLLRHALNGSRYTRFWPDGGEALWVLAWSLLGGALGMLFRSPWKLLPCVLLGVGFLYGVALLAFWRDWWLPLVPPLGTWVVSAFAVTSYVTHRERADRQAVMRLLADHVSTEVAQYIWENREVFLEGGKIRSREIIATVLFTDLQGFSTVSEKMSAEQVMDWLNELMDELTNCVLAYKGLLNKYIGDSVMAVFGAPVPSTTPAGLRRDAQGAVRCALAMRRTLVKLNRRWGARGLPVVGMRIGVFTGPLIAGSLGKASTGAAGGRMEYTVIGDTVNTASRLESFDKDLMGDEIAPDNCRILIGQTTLDLLEGRFRTRHIGSEPLKGKDEKISIHGVIAELPEGAELPQGPGPSAAPAGRPAGQGRPAAASPEQASSGPAVPR